MATGLRSGLLIMAVLALGCAGATGGEAAVEDPSLAGEETERPAGAASALAPDEVMVEYVAHACFRLQAADGTQLVIDP